MFNRGVVLRATQYGLIGLLEEESLISIEIPGKQKSGFGVFARSAFGVFCFSWVKVYGQDKRFYRLLGMSPDQP